MSVTQINARQAAIHFQLMSGAHYAIARSKLFQGNHEAAKANQRMGRVLSAHARDAMNAHKHGVGMVWMINGPVRGLNNAL